jgi:hypothetical protein
LAARDSGGKHTGAEGGTKESHPAPHDVKQGTGQHHTPSIKNDHHSNNPSPKAPRSPAPSGKGKGK